MTTGAEPLDDTVPAICLEVGARLRAIRKSKGLVLEDVKRASGGRWSSSAIGAYERGFRTLSLPRLVELADWYDVPITVLLGQPEHTPTGQVLRFDLSAHAFAADRLAGLRAFLRAMRIQRGDYSGQLTLRGSDLPAVTALVGADSPAEAVQFLDGLGVLVKEAT